MYKHCTQRKCSLHKEAVRDEAQSVCPVCGGWLTAVELEPGDTIPDFGFTILAKLPEGDGGMATVYRARIPAVRHDVALKLCRDNSYEYTALRREAHALAELQHPNIVRIIPVPAAHGTERYAPKVTVMGESRCFIVLEYVDGPSLRHQLRHKNTVRWPDAIRIVRQVGQALSFAHSKGFLHLDVKPSNILLDRTGRRVVLTDFGLVAPTDTGRRDPASGRRLLGTAGYMSPEHVSRQPLDYRADIFSLGVVLYEMLTGKAPFVKEDTSDTLKAVLRLEAVPPSQHDAKLIVMDAVLHKALAKDRSQRYQSTRELVEDTERALRARRGLFG